MEVLIDRASPMPRHEALGTAVPGRAIHKVRVDRDLSDYRGTGGVLHDLSLRYQDDEYLLVVSGAQLLTKSLPDLAAALASRAADVAVVAHDDGTPAAAFWVRCGCLKAIPELGFIDFKEQALPQMAQAHRVGVVKLPPLGMPLRTPAEYLRALRQHHVRNHHDDGSAIPFAEDWRPAFSLIEEGSDVHPSARMHDSVVLNGGRVGPNAVLVRSLVGPGGSVRSGECVIDQFVNGQGRSRDSSC
jgi:hypothetical protein